MNLSSTDASHSLALDVQALGALRASAKQNSPQALRESAKQFEALFLNMVLKSMRQTHFSEGSLTDSQDVQFYTSMLDQQLSQSLAQRGTGLAEVMLRQLNTQQVAQPATQSPQPQPGTARAPSAAPLAAPAVGAAPFGLGLGADVASANVPDRITAASGDTASRAASDPVRQFRAAMGVHAEEASRLTGLPSAFILGQAALESGWGKRQINAADGTPSHNLFGIKAGPGWKGRVVEVATTEYVQGLPQRAVARFRAYDSHAEAFRDYAALLLRNPRYEPVLSQGQTVAGFTQGLQKAGYATDPAYAAKLARVIQRTLSV
jgi:flagellar protein FlgJ